MLPNNKVGLYQVLAQSHTMHQYSPTLPNKQKESVLGRVVHIIEEVFQIEGTQICHNISLF